MPLINLPSYLGVEAFDPYVTTQVSGIHTIARRMDDESKNAHVSTLIATKKSLTRHKGDDHWQFNYFF